MSITLKSNFATLKKEFKTDTGLDVNAQNMSLYLQYYNARMSDYGFQVLTGLTNQLLNKIDFLPDQIRLKIAEMIRTHEVIKELLKRKS